MCKTTKDNNSVNVELERRQLGNCVVCGEPLFVPESAERGMGPWCAQTYRYVLDQVNGAADPVAFDEACARAGLTISLDAGLNKAGNAILQALCQGLAPEQATAACDALVALGLRNSAAIAGANLRIKGHDQGARKAAVSVVDAGKYGKRLAVKTSYCPELLDKFRAIPTRFFNRAEKRNEFATKPAIAKQVFAMIAENFPKATFSREARELVEQTEQAPATTEATPKAKPENNEPTCLTKVRGSELGIKAPYNPTLVARIKALPRGHRRFDPQTKAWWVTRPSWDEAVAIIKDMYGEDVRWAPELEGREEREADAKRLARATNVEADEAIELPGGRLYPFQSAGVRFLERQGEKFGAIVADDMGLGKTVQALAYLSRDASRLPALIVVPANVKLNWARQVNTWLNNGVTHKIAVVDGNKIFEVVEGRKTNKSDSMTTENCKAADVVVINYDLLRRHQDVLCAAGFSTLVLDESHYVMNSKSARSKACNAIAKTVTKRMLLTGTPMLNRPKELWHQLNICDPVVWKSFFNFGIEFCAGHRGRWGWDFTGVSNADRLHDQLIGHYMVRRRKSEVLEDLPAKTVTCTNIEVKAADRREYSQAASDFLSWAAAQGGDKLAKAQRAEAIARLTTLRRLAAEAKTEQAVAHAADFLASREDEQLVIFAHHRSVLTAMAKGLREAGHEVVSILGGDTSDQRQAAVDTFRTGQARVAVLSIMAAGTGTDGLQDRCQNALFVERTWRPADLAQAEDRLHRIGQTAPVFVEYLDMMGSIDTYLASMIEAKRAVFGEVVDGVSVVNETDVALGIIREMLK